ncbi:MAG TPA: peptidyl-prolyl cis-trans isomerase [Caulobacteraceae bacterium]|jgi:peptidyl-prolyl cis-trans isomerase D|nr:peptidyl-prolyl cis-trans isomerase [Caulobacteraceae bacterium]
MTGTLRSTARNPIAVALMGALILVFLILGVGGGRFPDAFRTVNADSVVSVGSHATNATEFQRDWDEQKQKFQQESGQPLTNEFLVQNGVDSQLIGQLASQDAAMEMVERDGVTPGSALVDQEIKKLPFAFDKVTGQFSQQQFVQALASRGMTPRQAQAEITDDLAIRHFGYAAAGGVQAPLLFVALSAAQAAESRDVSYFQLGIHAVAAPAEPTDAQLTAFMKAHATQLMQPEMRLITLAKFSAKDIAPTLKIDPAQVGKEFEFRKDTLSTPEKRSMVEIPVKTAADGAAVAQRLGRGEDPVAIAKSLGVEAITYAGQPASAIPDRKLAQAAFALKEGAVSGPVSGDLGLAAIKVLKVTPGAAATLASASPKIEAELRQKQAADQAYQLSQKFDDARQGGAGVADAARKAGVAAVTVGPVTAKGVDAQGKPNPLLTDRILKAAFALPAGQDGQLEDAGSGEYFAVKVEKVLPPALPALADKRPQLVQAYKIDALVTALKAKAMALMALARKSGNLDAAASQAGVKVTRENGMQRIKAQQYQALGREFVENAFSLKAGEVFAAGGQGGIYVGRIDATHPADPQQTAQLVAAVRGRASQAYADDLLSAFQAAAKAKLKVSINLALARKTLGVDPNLMGGTGGKAAKAK